MVILGQCLMIVMYYASIHQQSSTCISELSSTSYQQSNVLYYLAIAECDPK